MSLLLQHHRAAECHLSYCTMWLVRHEWKFSEGYIKVNPGHILLFIARFNVRVIIEISIIMYGNPGLGLNTLEKYGNWENRA